MFESKFCDICGKPAKEYRFGTLLCGDPNCLEKAQTLRGGPAGHKLRVVSVGSLNPVITSYSIHYTKLYEGLRDIN